MTHDKLVSFRLPQEQVDALAAIKARDGAPVGEQIRRALKLWIAQQLPKRRAPKGAR